MLERLLGDGDSSRLELDLVREHEVATETSADMQWGIDPELFTIYAQARPGRRAARLEDARSTPCCATSAETPVPADELAKAKRQLAADSCRGLKTVSGKANQHRLLRGRRGSCACINCCSFRSTLPVNNLKEFVALMKKDGPKMNYASPGIGDPGHINFEWFKLAAGFDMVHVPYKGTAPALQGMLAGEAHAFLSSVLTTEQYVKTGKMKPIVISGKVRSSIYPNLETIHEQGYPQVAFGFWLALVTTAGTPPAIVRKISDDTRKVMTSPAFREKYIQPYEFEALSDTPEEFADFLKADIVEAEKKVKASGAKLD